MTDTGVVLHAVYSVLKGPILSLLDATLSMLIRELSHRGRSADQSMLNLNWAIRGGSHLLPYKVIVGSNLGRAPVFERLSRDIAVLPIFTIRNGPEAGN